MGRLRLAAPCLFLGLLATLLSLPAAAEPRTGDVVRIEGQVVDGGNRVVGSVDVALEVSRTRFSLRRMDRVESQPLRIPTRADDDGKFSFDWRWDSHYNTFEVAVGMEVQRGGRPGFEIVRRLDVTDAVTAGGPVQLRVEVPDGSYLRWLRGYVGGKASADEEKIFRDKGRPDRVERSEHFPGESTWWYFTEGKAYRFRDGGFDRVVHFEPLPVPAPGEG